MASRLGILLLVSGPSGSGKTTLCRRLATEGGAHYATSCTTRTPRPGETDGTDYYFLTRPDFESRIAQGHFLEHAEVHGNRYGTLKSEVLSHLSDGRDVVIDIDVQGAALVRQCPDPEIQRSLVDLFVMPPNHDELHRRLTHRNTDSEEVIALRMKNALDEMTHWTDYSYRILSGTHEEDYLAFKSLVIAERLRVSRIS